MTKAAALRARNRLRTDRTQQTPSMRSRQHPARATTARASIQLVSAIVLAAVPLAASAQARAVPPVWQELSVDDEVEHYVRSLQGLGTVPAVPWSLRQFSRTQIDALHPTGAHPWAARLGAAPDSGPGAWLLRPRLGLAYNSAFPHGGNDGAVWAGRGVTASVSAGAAFRWGPVSLVLQPIAFWAQNQAFALHDNGRTGIEAYGDALYPESIDRPQRFGDGAYARVDPGQSTLRVDALGATLGVSTANQWWGPAQEFPFLLGSNAAGFPHAFVGTARPANLWVARLHARLLYGRLDATDHFVPTGPVSRARRFATGLIVVATPRGMPNLELGAARFIHAPWPDEGLPNRYLVRPFEGIFKTSLPEVDGAIDADSRSIDGENQLGVLFARLVLPRTGFEVYGELGREDHPWDLRHLILSPEEQSSVTVGLRRTWRRGAGLGVVRAEVIDFRQRQVDRFRLGPAIYIHVNGSNQGHTQRGQLLGADVGVGSSSGAVLGVDLYDAGGRSSVEWRRVVRLERRALDQGLEPLNVVHTLGVERLVFRGSTDLSAGADLSYAFHHNFGGDRVNLRLRVSATPSAW